MSPIKIIRIPILPFGMVNAHLITGEAGSILVDAGIPDSEHKIERVLARYGLAIMPVARHACANYRAPRS